jgi:hypothetical protein
MFRVEHIDVSLLCSGKLAAADCMWRKTLEIEPICAPACAKVSDVGLLLNFQQL